MTARRWITHGALLVTALAVAIQPAAAQTIETLSLRGQPQQLRVYGTRGAGDPVLLSSGDGGWMHLAPEVAVMLAATGFFVVGFDTKEYCAASPAAARPCAPRTSLGTTGRSPSSRRVEDRRKPCSSASRKARRCRHWRQPTGRHSRRSPA